MQVSIYINPFLMEKVDRKAKQKKKSRSQYIQDVLEHTIVGQTEETVFDKIFNSVPEATGKDMLKTIYKTRHNSKRFA